MNFNKSPSVEKGSSAPKNELFNRLLQKARKLLPSISPKVLFGIAIVSGLSINELKAQKIEVPDKDAIGAYDQVKSEVDIWKNSLENPEYRTRLLGLLRNDTARTDQVIKTRKENLENAVINILTAKGFSDSLESNLGKLYPAFGFSNEDTKTAFIGTSLGNKKSGTDYVKGRKNRELMGTLYSTEEKDGVGKGVTIHELLHIIIGHNLTKEEETLILSVLPLELQKKISLTKDQDVKKMRNWIVSLKEIYPRLAEISAFLTSVNEKKGHITIDNIELLMKNAPDILKNTYSALKEDAGISTDNMVMLLNKLPLPIVETKELPITKN